MSSIVIKRIYEPVESTDGVRILVDRLWPRGMKKENAHIDEWLKEAAPSAILRKWFNHEPEKWQEFSTRYLAELKQNTAIDGLLNIVKGNEKVTLLYGAHDKEHNQALVLQQFLNSLLK
jgi:uncharacterized protein YeaO (DUF488 family)